MTKSLDSSDDAFDADSIQVHRVTADDCPNPRCKFDDVHIVVEWEGEHYEKQNSWIAFKGDGVVNIDDHR